MIPDKISQFKTDNPLKKLYRTINNIKVGVFLGMNRRWNKQDIVASINHLEVIKNVIAEGETGSRYSFMVIMSSAIAVLGLLLSSPAVVIGAMLISPLMSPIMSLGFSFCVLNFWWIKKSLQGIVWGSLLAITISALIVALSPISDPTPEIIARTQPNLFDLMVAIFSGLAGGYSTIRKKGDTIVGVAIATALMPPLAVVGYGIATFNWVIAEGAFFLFMTNLLAICFTVVAITKWYGFGSYNSDKYSAWQGLVIFIVFVFLSIPLGLSLKNIAYQSYSTKVAKGDIQKYFQSANSRFTNFSISFKGKKDIIIDAVLVTDKYLPSAKKDLEKQIAQDLNHDVILSLDQIVIAKDEQNSIVDNTQMPNQIQPAQVNQKDDLSQTIRNIISLPIEFIKINYDKNKILIYPQLTSSLDISLLRDQEKIVRAKFPGWIIFTIPNAQTIPTITFKKGEYKIDETINIDDIIWLLKRWNVYNVSLSGYSNKKAESEKLSNQTLTKQRLKTISKILEDEGFEIKQTEIYTSSNGIAESGYVEIKTNN